MDALRAALGTPRLTQLLTPPRPRATTHTCPGSPPRAAAEGFQTEAVPADDEERSRFALEKEAVNTAETITRLHGFFGETVESLGSLGADIDVMRASLAKIQTIAETARAEHGRAGGSSQARQDSAQLLADTKARCEQIERDRQVRLPSHPTRPRNRLLAHASPRAAAQWELEYVKSLAPKDPTPKVLLMEVVPVDAPESPDTAWLAQARERMESIIKEGGLHGTKRADKQGGPRSNPTEADEGRTQG